MSVEAATIATPLPATRSRLSNGSSLFLGKVDGRSALARRQRDLQRAYAAELGGTLTTAQMARVAQVAALQVRAEQLQAAIANGDPIRDEDLVRVTNALRREIADLGLGRNGIAPIDTGAPVSGSKILDILRRQREGNAHESD
jgi:hypothetical protein